MACGGVVGAAAGVDTAVTQLTKFAGGGVITPIGDNPMLACVVDAVRYVAEVELLFITDSDKT